MSEPIELPTLVEIRAAIKQQDLYFELWPEHMARAQLIVAGSGRALFESCEYSRQPQLCGHTIEDADAVGAEFYLGLDVTPHAGWLPRYGVVSVLEALDPAHAALPLCALCVPQLLRAGRVVLTNPQFIDELLASRREAAVNV